MTGAGGRAFRLQGVQFQIWLRSVNHRFLETQFRLPPALQSLETQLEDLLRARFRRGRIELEIESSDPGDFQTVRINHKLAKQYLQLGRELAKQSGADEASIDPLQLLRLPGVAVLEQKLPGNFPRRRFLREFERALADLKKARQAEGRALQQSLDELLRSIDAQRKAVAKRHQTQRTEQRRKKRAEAREAAAKNETGDGAREAQDNPEKGEIREELDRLGMHVRAVRGILKSKDEPDAGKRIDFFLQEMQREVNTIASKSRDFAIRSAAVDCKTAIENMKEQARNVV